MATTASVYNASRTTRQILKRHKKNGPSLILHLHPTTFRIERQNGSFLYDSVMKNLLFFIRDQRVPADLIDLFDEANIPFFEGCLIVEIHDHRSSDESKSSALPSAQLNRLSNISSSSAQALHPELSPSLQHPGRTARELGGNYGFFRRMGIDSRTRRDDSHGPTPAIYRVVLYPSSETLWTDLRHLNNVEGGGLWTDDEVLQMESRILNITSPPLCLTPDLQVSRIANLMLSATALPSTYSPVASSPLPYHRRASRKRGINSIEVEMDKANKKRREKILRLMEHGSRTNDGLVGPSSRANNFSRMSFIERWRAGKAAPGSHPALSNIVKDSLGKREDIMSEEAKKANLAIKKKKSQSRKSDDGKEESVPPSAPVKKKTKKQLLREKEEQEKAERDHAEQEANESRRRDEESKKKKKAKKREKEQEQNVPSSDAASAGTPTRRGTSIQGMTGGKKPAKTKKKGDGMSDGGTATPTQQHNPHPTPSPQQQVMQQMQQQSNLGMFPQQSMAGFPLMQQQGQSIPQMGSNAFNNNPFSMNGTTNTMMLPGQQASFAPQQQQLQEQLALQRALQQAGIQNQMSANSNNMNLGSGRMGMNMGNSQMQHLQALAALHPQQQGTQQHSNADNQTFGNQDNLPVGVGLGNLPTNWGNLG